MDAGNGRPYLPRQRLPGIGDMGQDIEEVARLGIDNLLNLGQLLLSVSHHDVNITLIN